ncbi:preprotein translocase subunit SecY [Candidatus Woesearchaeota archaeon]|nr:preprotein translocase subunit SecY [Candidatus Woesearchaeota archaeon]MCF7901360.1 preprotein translocase subunit SecY [Candidatus Woesearchaeota archaeon]MCF8013360.1 preprotein translocase subunit SecY [Candidatus Woesearchaeota archaeon]
MGFLDNLISVLPEVKPPTQKKLSFSEKLRWTSIVLLLYFVLSHVPVFGLGQNTLAQFEFLSTILGASFGSLVSLGIGPIVTASIVLQLLQGSGLVRFDLSSEQGKRRFQGLQKILSVFFILLEATIFVITGALGADPGMTGIVIFQIALGGLFVLFMDEIVSKYGFGSGISLFIAAGVSQQIFLQLFNPLVGDGASLPAGHVIAILSALFTQTGTDIIATSFAIILATVLIYLLVVYVQAMKVEIPLSFGRVSGHGIRWPLNFLYANVIPIILVSALIANFQLLSQMWPSLQPIFNWINAPNILQAAFNGQLFAVGAWTIIAQALIYLLIYIVGATVFSLFWVQTSGLDASSQAQQMINSGLQIPGFRRDKRVLERMLKRYITPLTVMGGISIGILATLADLTGAIGTGTGLLLTVIIIYKLYEDIAKQHMYDMNPMMKKFMKF